MEYNLAKVGVAGSNPVSRFFVPHHAVRKYNINLQRYRSGHNEAVLKTVWGQPHGGSNPSRCAKKRNVISDIPFFFFSLSLAHEPWRNTPDASDKGQNFLPQGFLAVSQEQHPVVFLIRLISIGTDVLQAIPVGIQFCQEHNDLLAGSVNR